MVRRLFALVAILALVAGPAWAVTKDGSADGPNVASTPGTPSQLRAVLEFNTGGAIGTLPTSGGSPTAWASAEVGQATNTSGQDLCVVELGFPCSGTTTSAYGWVVWTNQTPGVAPGPMTSAPHHGQFTPVDPVGLPPVTYTYIPLADLGVINWPAGTTVTFGLENTGYIGLIAYTGNLTWGWYLGAWDPDANYGYTCVMQIKGDPCGGTPVDETTWGRVKNLF